VNDGATVTGTVELEGILKQLFDFPEKDRKSILRACAKEAAPEILTAHYNRNVGNWAPPDPGYANTAAKRGKGQLILTGNMHHGITAKKAPASLRRVVIAKGKSPNSYRISISLRKMVNGDNVYTFAQKGRGSHATVETKSGLKGNVSFKDLNKANMELSRAYHQSGRSGSFRGFARKHSGFKSVNVERSGGRMVCQNEPGDENFFKDRIGEAVRKYMERKAKKAKKR
jgi:hypothetical protein